MCCASAGRLPAHPEAWELVPQGPCALRGPDCGRGGQAGRSGSTAGRSGAVGASGSSTVPAQLAPGRSGATGGLDAGACSSQPPGWTGFVRSFSSPISSHLPVFSGRCSRPLVSFSTDTHTLPGIAECLLRICWMPEQTWGPEAVRTAQREVSATRELALRRPGKRALPEGARCLAYEELRAGTRHGPVALTVGRT